MGRYPRGNIVNLVERRQLNAQGDWRVLFQRCKRANLLWSQLIRGSDAIRWDRDVGGAQQDLVANFALMFTSSTCSLASPGDPVRAAVGPARG